MFLPKQTNHCLTVLLFCNKKCTRVHQKINLTPPSIKQTHSKEICFLLNKNIGTFIYFECSHQVFLNTFHTIWWVSQFQIYKKWSNLLWDYFLHFIICSEMLVLVWGDQKGDSHKVPDQGHKADVTTFPTWIFTATSARHRLHNLIFQTFSL